MKILLVNPPGGSHYDGPMMGIAALAGQLRARGYPEVRLLDLDLALYHRAGTREMLEEVCALLRRPAAAEGRDPRPGWARRLGARLLGPAFLRGLARRVIRERPRLEAFRNAVPVDRWFPEEGLVDYKKGCARVLKLMTLYCYPFLAYPRFFSLGEKRIFHWFHLKVGYLLSQVFDHGRTLLVRFYAETLLPRIGPERCDVLGVSVSFKHQLEPALLLVDTVRAAGLPVKIVLGGSYITTVVDAGRLEDDLLRAVDFVLVSEGEEAFCDLLDRLRDGEPLEDVPNLVYLREGQRTTNPRRTIPDLDALAPPDYGDLPLAAYLERPVRLPLMTCRGCYWGRCTYCSHHWTLGSGRLRTRSPERLLEDIRGFRDRFGANSIYFTDEAVYPPTLEVLARRLIEEERPVYWVGMLRFDECVDRPFLELLRDAGCHAIMFGLESVSEHVQRIIDKGIDLRRARAALEHCRDLGIKVHIFIILGIPGEREEDMQANIDFLLRNRDLYETVQLAPFQLMEGSPMHRRPERFGIRNIRTVRMGDRASFSTLAFETTEGLDRAHVARYVELLTKNKLLFERDLWEGYGYRIYTLSPRFVQARAPRHPAPIASKR